MTFFSTLYESVCGVNTNYTEYRDELFRSIGLFTLVAATLICLLFYVFLGRWKLIWFNNIHWAVTIVFCALTGFLLAFLMAESSLRLVDGYLIRFALFNALFAALYFVILSFVFKNFSVFSKRTPI
jgi:hypothetical protein